METYDPPKEVEEKENNSDLPEKEVISETCSTLCVSMMVKQYGTT